MYDVKINLSTNLERTRALMSEKNSLPHHPQIMTAGSVEEETKLYLRQGLVKLTIMTTGGTIEKTYDENDGSLENRGTVISNKIHQKLRLPNTEIKVIPLMSKDSIYMDDQDREKIFQALLEAVKDARPIIVLHGTDTMEMTAKYCFQKKATWEVPIIFTGAMIPLGFEDSDALQNVTEALFACRFIESGLYLSFHNQLFKVPFVTKNRQLRTFESTLL